MVWTFGSTLPLGSRVPYFSLPDVDGHEISVASLSDAPVLVVMFICNHCPFVRHIAEGLAAFGLEYQAKGVAVVAINSNDSSTYPYDSPAQMRVEVKERNYTFPYLFDETQDVARAFHATCTPDFFVFDSQRRLVYHGQFDSSRPRSRDPVTGKDLRRAVSSVLSKQPLRGTQIPSVGCSIKWRAESESSDAGAGTHPE